MRKMKFKNIVNPLILGIAVMFAFTATNLYSQCGMMKGHGSHSDHQMQNSVSGDTTLIRKGLIDLESIDVNKDGKVFQDQMDWNVISDVAGKCPLCGMILKEVTLHEAKDNLKKNGFKVKE